MEDPGKVYQTEAGNAMRVGLAIGKLPAMLQDIVRHVLEQEPGFEVIAMDDVAEKDLAQAVETHTLQALITSSPNDGQAVALMTLLYERPRLRVLGLTTDGHSADLFALKPHRKRLRELTPATLVHALRCNDADG